MKLSLRLILLFRKDFLHLSSGPPSIVFLIIHTLKKMKKLSGSREGEFAKTQKGNFFIDTI